MFFVPVMPEKSAVVSKGALIPSNEILVWKKSKIIFYKKYIPLFLNWPSPRLDLPEVVLLNRAWLGHEMLEIYIFSNFLNL